MRKELLEKLNKSMKDIYCFQLGAEGLPEDTLVVFQTNITGQLSRMASVAFGIFYLYWEIYDESNKVLLLIGVVFPILFLLLYFYYRSQKNILTREGTVLLDPRSKSAAVASIFGKGTFYKVDTLNYFYAESDNMLFVTVFNSLDRKPKHLNVCSISRASQPDKYLDSIIELAESLGLKIDSQPVTQLQLLVNF